MNGGDNVLIFEHQLGKNISANAGWGDDTLVLPGNQSDYNLDALHINNGIISGQIFGSHNSYITINNFDTVVFNDGFIGKGGIDTVTEEVQVQVPFEDTKIVEDTTAEDTTDAVSEDTIDENTVDTVDENTTDEQTTDAVDENTVAENTVDAINEDTIDERMGYHTDRFNSCVETNKKGCFRHMYSQHLKVNIIEKHEMKRGRCVPFCLQWQK